MSCRMLISTMQGSWSYLIVQFVKNCLHQYCPIELILDSWEHANNPDMKQITICHQCQQSLCIKYRSMDTIILQAEFLRGKRKMSEEEEAAEDLLEARRSMEEASGSNTTTGSNQAGGKRRPSGSSLSNKSPVASSSSSHPQERSPPNLGGSPTGSAPITSPNNSTTMPNSAEFEGSFRLWAKPTCSLSLPSGSTLPEVHTTYPWTYTETEISSGEDWGGGLAQSWPSGWSGTWSPGWAATWSWSPSRSSTFPQSTTWTQGLRQQPIQPDAWTYPQEQR